jgi:predicted P-loop ATPase
LRILGLDKYFDDNLEFGASTKEIMEISSGVLIHEVPELSKMSDRRVETVKAMLSRQKDKARMAYGRTTTQMPRQFILIGTSNDRKYLKDATGGVRFWPVWSHATLARPIDTDGLAKVVRLMWGEAAYRERQGESLFLQGEALRLAQIAQGERYAGDDNFDKISDAVEGKEGFVPSTVVLDACEITDERLRAATATSKSIAAAMTKNGWKPDRRRLKRGNNTSNPVRGWAKGDLPEGALSSWWEWSAQERALAPIVAKIRSPADASATAQAAA